MRLQLAALFEASDMVLVDGFMEATPVVIPAPDAVLCVAVQRGFLKHAATITFVDQPVYMVGNGEIGHPVESVALTKHQLRFIRCVPLTPEHLPAQTTGPLAKPG